MDHVNRNDIITPTRSLLRKSLPNSQTIAYEQKHFKRSQKHEEELLHCMIRLQKGFRFHSS